MKIRLVGAELFLCVRTYGRKDGDMANLIVAFRNFSNARNKNSFTFSFECY